MELFEMRILMKCHIEKIWDRSENVWNRIYKTFIAKRHLVEKLVFILQCCILYYYILLDNCLDF